MKEGDMTVVEAKQQVWEQRVETLKRKIAGHKAAITELEKQLSADSEKLEQFREKIAEKTVTA